ncbi:hypothetical protein PR048_021878 [Dryococelus australis]|uniref:Reverse transcriptase RNase H-like domain-containing protein n=1 Tax=Dryococelus australis TaxID=614101 RepID=A0ABQ9GZG6_9NEOP|nr:hypothetical protein PR048_021878 [Dryococelus australis]
MVAEALEFVNDYYCDGVEFKVDSVIRWFQELVLENRLKCYFKLDTGADVNLIPMSVFENPILGLHTCIQLRLIQKRQVDKVDSANSKLIVSEKGGIINKYTDVFTDTGRSPLKNKVALRKNASPVSNTPNAVPLKPEDKLKDELDRLCLLGVISKVNKPTERVSQLGMNGQIDKEFFAILVACKKFHYYIYGRYTIIHTDHQPSVTLMRKYLNSIGSQRLRKIKMKLMT